MNDQFISRLKSSLIQEGFVLRESNAENGSEMYLKESKVVNVYQNEGWIFFEYWNRNAFRRYHAAKDRLKFRLGLSKTDESCDFDDGWEGVVIESKRLRMTKQEGVDLFLGKVFS